MALRRRPGPGLKGAPFLRQVVSLEEKFDTTTFPFNIPAFSNGIDLTFNSKVTFLVGENGSGKSTLLEALAECCGFSSEGGSRDHNRAAFADRSPLAQAIRLSWQPKVVDGFFLRAESFYNIAAYLDEVSSLQRYGGKALNAQSGHAQFLIATHSPIILSYPGAVLFALDDEGIRETSYRETKHFVLTRDFLNSPESFFKHLFSADDDKVGDG